MLKFNQLSIQKKLTILIMVTSAVVILLSFIAFTTVEIFSLRQAMLNDLGIMADITAQNSSAAIVFNDSKAAQQNLMTLKSKPSILLARIYDVRGDLIAEYHKEQKSIPLPEYIDIETGLSLDQLISRIASDAVTEGIPGLDYYMDVVHNIGLDGENIGTVYLMSSMEGMYVRLKRQMVSGLVIVALIFLLSWFLSIRLQAVVSAPILNLADTMKGVSKEKNYALRVQKRNEDEIGILYDGFNQMLSWVQARDAALARHRDMLEEEVRQRTQELHGKNAELVEVVKQLKLSKKAAEAANQAKSRFLANMSHELRTPLHHILGFIEMILGKYFGGLTETQEEYLTDCFHSSQHLLGLINEMLDLSKIESGKMELRAGDIDLKALFQKSLMMFKEKSLKHAIKMDLEVHDAPSMIAADEQKLKQVMYNLLSNAVKFTPDGGRILLTSRCISLDENDQYTVLLQQSHYPYASSDDFLMQHPFSLWVTVKDTGIGMEPDVLEQIFTPLEQVDNSFNRKYQGTGLGLTLSRRFIELHQGKIWAHSKGNGKGSEFHFMIPLQTAGDTRLPLASSQ